MYTGECSSHPSIKKHFFAKDRDYYRKSELIKMQKTSMCVPSHTDPSTTQCLHLSLRKPLKRKTENSQEPEKHGVCYENATPRNVREGTLIKSQQHSWLNKA